MYISLHTIESSRLPISLSYKTPINIVFVEIIVKYYKIMWIPFSFHM